MTIKPPPIPEPAICQQGDDYFTTTQLREHDAQWQVIVEQEKKAAYEAGYSQVIKDIDRSNT